jgi:hypothetical protein
MCLQYILISFTPFPPFLEQFLQFSLFCFHTWEQNTSYLPSFILSLCPPPGTHPWTGPVLPSCLFFLLNILFIYNSYIGSSSMTFPYIQVLYPAITLPPVPFFLRWLHQVSVFCILLRFILTFVELNIGFIFLGFGPGYIKRPGKVQESVV